MPYLVDEVGAVDGERGVCLRKRRLFYLPGIRKSYCWQLEENRKLYSCNQKRSEERTLALRNQI